MLKRYRELKSKGKVAVSKEMVDIDNLDKAKIEHDFFDELTGETKNKRIFHLTLTEIEAQIVGLQSDTGRLESELTKVEDERLDLEELLNDIITLGVKSLSIGGPSPNQGLRIKTKKG